MEPVDVMELFLQYTGLEQAQPLHEALCAQGIAAVEKRLLVQPSQQQLVLLCACAAAYAVYRLALVQCAAGPLVVQAGGMKTEQDTRAENARALWLQSLSNAADLLGAEDFAFAGVE